MGVGRVQDAFYGTTQGSFVAYGGLFRGQPWACGGSRMPSTGQPMGLSRLTEAFFGDSHGRVVAPHSYFAKLVPPRLPRALRVLPAVRGRRCKRVLFRRHPPTPNPTTSLQKSAGTSPSYTTACSGPISTCSTRRARASSALDDDAKFSHDRSSSYTYANRTDRESLSRYFG